MNTTPQVGNHIEVIVKNLSSVSRTLFPNEPETNTYVGTVVQRDSWLTPDYFCMTTGNPSFPIRAIRMANVVALNGAPVDYKPHTDGVITKTYIGSKGATYTLTSKDGEVSCTCPGFLFHKGKCKHIDDFLGVKREEKPTAKHSAKAKKSTSVVRTKGASKIERARELYDQLNGDRQSCIKAFMKELGMSQAGASTYHYNIRKEQVK